MKYTNLTLGEKLNESRNYQEQLEWIKAIDSANTKAIRVETRERANAIKIAESFKSQAPNRSWYGFWND
jgi:hypothetical protein